MGTCVRDVAGLSLHALPSRARFEHDGDIYLTFRTFDDPSSGTSNALAFARSTNGGQSFSRARKIQDIVPYFPFDSGQRDCGDGPFLCPADFVFHRVPLEPRVTADQTGELPGVYLTYNEIRPSSTEESATSYNSAGPGLVGQSLVFVVRSLNNGASWSDPVAVDPDPRGHQFFPDVDAFEGELGVVWQDNRTDPAYDVQFPIGNLYDPDDHAISSGTNVVNTFFTSLGNPTAFTFAPSTKVSSVSHQSEFEMFGARDIPFHGDYNWISLALDGSSVFAYMTWTDNRDVVAGDDPRETDPDGNPATTDGFDDNFDVHKCLEFDAETGTYGKPLRKRRWTGSEHLRRPSVAAVRDGRERRGRLGPASSLGSCFKKEVHGGKPGFPRSGLHHVGHAARHPGADRLLRHLGTIAILSSRRHLGVRKANDVDSSQVHKRAEATRYPAARFDKTVPKLGLELRAGDDRQRACLALSRRRH